MVQLADVHVASVRPVPMSMILSGTPKMPGLKFGVAVSVTAWPDPGDVVDAVKVTVVACQVTDTVVDDTLALPLMTA